MYMFIYFGELGLGWGYKVLVDFSVGRSRWIIMWLSIVYWNMCNNSGVIRVMVGRTSRLVVQCDGCDIFYFIIVTTNGTRLYGL